MLVRLMKHDNHVMKGEENLLVTLQAAIAKKVGCNIFCATFFAKMQLFLDCTTWLHNRRKSPIGTKTRDNESETDLIK